MHALKINHMVNAIVLKAPSYPDKRWFSDIATPRYNGEVDGELIWDLITGALDASRINIIYKNHCPHTALSGFATRGPTCRRRTKLCDARPGDIAAASTLVMPVYLSRLNQYLPISEGAFYAMFRDTLLPSCQGFL